MSGVNRSALVLHDGASLSYLTTGMPSDDPVLLIHGSTETAESDWFVHSPIGSRLAQLGYFVIARIAAPMAAPLRRAMISVGSCTRSNRWPPTAPSCYALLPHIGPLLPHIGPLLPHIGPKTTARTENRLMCGVTATICGAIVDGAQH